MNAWVEWSGGECPVPANEIVEVRLRNGEVGSGPCGEYRWVWVGASSVADIVAYRRFLSSTGDPRSALARQEGGDHYKKLKIQPMEYSMANGLDACQHTVVKYVTRFRDKGGIADLRKAIHSIELLIEFEERRAAEEPRP